MRFMCNTHRQQVLSEPNHAIRFWEQWMEQGQRHFHQCNWIDASHFFGCSFEISEWLIQTSNITDHRNTPLNYAERVMLSGHSLAECYKQLDEKQLELDMLIQVHNLLTYTDKHFFKTHWLMDSYLAKSLTSIRQHIKQKNKPKDHGKWNRFFQSTA